MTDHPYQCVQCHKTYKGLKTYSNHLRNYHSPEGEAITCSECHESLPNRRALKRHHAKEHTIHQCPHCRRLYKTKATLRYHLYTHDRAKSFQCLVDECRQTFDHPKLLAGHKQKCHQANDGVKKFICEVCGYATNERSNFVVHRRRHSAVNPYCCEACGKCFPSSTQLAAHKATHTSDRPYTCDICGVTFRLRRSLYHHRPLHWAEKKYECPMCGRRYAQASAFSQHKRRHLRRMAKVTDAIETNRLVEGLE